MKNITQDDNQDSKIPFVVILLALLGMITFLAALAGWYLIVKSIQSQP